jgi:two-component sensor histidine kinase
MAFHELATNAAKYGSLSNEIGKLNIVWDVTPVSGEDMLN